MAKDFGTWEDSTPRKFVSISPAIYLDEFIQSEFPVYCQFQDGSFADKDYLIYYRRKKHIIHFNSGQLNDEKYKNTKISRLFCEYSPSINCIMGDNPISLPVNFEIKDAFRSVCKIKIEPKFSLIVFLEKE